VDRPSKRSGPEVSCRIRIRQRSDDGRIFRIVLVRDLGAYSGAAMVLLIAQPYRTDPSLQRPYSWPNVLITTPQRVVTEFAAHPPESPLDLHFQELLDVQIPLTSKFPFNGRPIPILELAIVVTVQPCMTPIGTNRVARLGLPSARTL